MNIINVNDSENFRRFEKQKNYFGAVLNLSEKFGAQKLGFHIEIIDPQNFSAPYHYHEQEEELFLVLEGEAIIRCAGKFHKIKAGDLFFYPVGPQHAHNMYNHTDKPFKFLGIANTSIEFDTCHYPDSRKRTSENGILQENGQTVDYYKNEEDPGQYWPEWALRGDF